MTASIPASQLATVLQGLHELLSVAHYLLLWTMFSLTVLGLVALLSGIPERVLLSKRVVDRAEASPGTSFLMGFLAASVTLLLLVFLFRNAPLLGIVVAAPAVVKGLIPAILAAATAAFARLYRKKEEPTLTELLSGACALQLIGFFHVVGFLLWAYWVCLSLGAMILCRLRGPVVILPVEGDARPDLSRSDERVTPEGLERTDSE